MFEAIFMFRGKLGRLQYFLAGLVVVLVGGLAIVMGLLSVKQQGSPVSGLLTIVVVALVLLWTSLSIQAARLRDIGLSPLPVIIGFMVFSGVMQVMLRESAGTTSGSVLAVLGTGIHLLYSLFLLFMPGSGSGNANPPSSLDRSAGMDLHTTMVWDDRPARTSQPARQPMETARPKSSVPSIRPSAPQGKPTFGRRGM